MIVCILCLIASPAFAWVNQDDQNWQRVNKYFNEYRQIIKKQKYNCEDAVECLGNACRYIPYADMDKQTKINLKGYFHYLAAQEYLKDGKKK